MAGITAERGISMEIRKKQDGEKLEICIEGRLDTNSAPVLQKSMEELLEETDLSVPELAQILGILLKKGFVTEAFKNCYIRRI